MKNIQFFDKSDGVFRLPLEVKSGTGGRRAEGFSGTRNLLSNEQIALECPRSLSQVIKAQITRRIHLLKDSSRSFSLEFGVRVGRFHQHRD